MLIDTDSDLDSIWCDSEISDIIDHKHSTIAGSQLGLSKLKAALAVDHLCPAEYRAKAWKLLLGVYNLSASNYIHLIEMGPSSLDEKIRNDTFRTLTTDYAFLESVSEDMLVRVLNAFVWTNDEHDPRASNIRSQFDCHRSKPLSYVQGMNVLAAPFLMAMDEMEAFHTYSTFIWKWCPLYVQPNMIGVHCGLRLLDLCLRALDPALYGYLRGKNLYANTYAFASVMTFSACTAPLSELLELWDYMFASGTHLNILFIIAQLALMRKEILQSASPANLLRVLPPLRAKEIINLTKSLCKSLPRNLYDQLQRHAYDEKVALELGISTTSTSSSEDHDDTSDLPAYMLDAMRNQGKSGQSSLI